MFEEWTPYLNEDDLHLIRDFVQKDILVHRFIHISFQPEQEHIHHYMKKCISDTLKDDCYIFSDEELTEFEESTNIMNMIHDFEEPLNNEVEDGVEYNSEYDLNVVELFTKSFIATSVLGP